MTTTMAWTGFVAGGLACCALVQCGSGGPASGSDAVAGVDATSADAFLDAVGDGGEADVMGDVAAGCSCGASEVCMKYITRAGAPGTACFPLAAACDGGEATCDCMKESACPQDAGPTRACEATANPGVLFCVTNLP